jgi:hypothetical protein
MGIRETLAQRRSGASGSPLGDTSLSDFFQEQVLSDAEVARKDAAKLRERLYHTAAVDDMTDYIKQAFDDPEVIDKRQAWAEKAQANNLIRRIVDEKSMLYLRPAIRKVDGDENNTRFDKLQRLTFQNIAMREASRKLNLHNDVLLQFRVRIDGDLRVPVIDVIHPGQFTAVGHPLDPTLLVALVIEWTREGARPEDPHYRVVTHEEDFWLDGHARVIGQSFADAEYERMNFLLLSAVPPTIRGKLLDGKTGSDLVNAHFGAWFQGVLLLKESKSINNQIAFAGDLSTTPTGQSQDSEQDLILGEGVTPTTINRGIDLAQYRDTADYFEERAAGNHGIPPSILRHQGATSGHEIELRMLPLAILREMQIEVFRPAERMLAEIQSMVIAEEMPQLAFSTEGFHVDFADIRIPRSAREATEVFIADRKAGLTDTVEEIIRRNPDLTEEQAEQEQFEHIMRETVRNVAMRPLKEVSGSMNASAAIENDEDEPNLRIVGDDE